MKNRLLLAILILAIKAGAQAPGDSIASIIKVPEFYHPGDVTVGDTVYSIKCYDADDSLLEHWTSFDEVYFVSVFKNFPDRYHTYRDDDGKQKPLPMKLIVDRYDRAGSGKWLNVNYTTHQYRELIEYKDEIVKTDMAIANGKAYKMLYYKVAAKK